MVLLYGAKIAMTGSGMIKKREEDCVLMKAPNTLCETEQLAKLKPL